MKTIKSIFIVFSLLISLPFVSNAQKVDSASQKKVIENKFDSTITIKRHWGFRKGVDKFYIMNGRAINDFELNRCLSLFPVSDSMWVKTSKHKKITLVRAVELTLLIGVGTVFVELTDQGSEVPDNQLWIFPVTFMGAGVAIIIAHNVYSAISEHHHLHKALKLYNQEIVKRHK